MKARILSLILSIGVLFIGVACGNTSNETLNNEIQSNEYRIASTQTWTYDKGGEESGYTYTENYENELTQNIITQTNGKEIYTKYEYIYDENGNPIKRYSYETDKNGNIIGEEISVEFKNGYDESGNLSRTEYSESNGQETIIKYNKNGKRIYREFNLNRLKYIFEYDDNGNVIHQITKDNLSDEYSEITYEYDEFGNILKSESQIYGETKKYDFEVEYEYDNKNKIEKCVSICGTEKMVSEFEYNSNGDYTRTQKYYTNDIMTQKTVVNYVLK